jgi:NhaP-type Na+/H+ or K+/H+ antiporter
MTFLKKYKRAIIAMCISLLILAIGMIIGITIGMFFRLKYPIPSIIGVVVGMTCSEVFDKVWGEHYINEIREEN